MTILGSKFITQFFNSLALGTIFIVN